MDCGITTSDITLGFDVDADCKNTLGLTDEGRALVQEMMDRGMLVDAAHMSEASVRDLQDISIANSYYPIYISHGHFREIMTAEKELEEKTTPVWVIEILRETGGMIGLRTAHEEVDTYEGSAVDNLCHGSSRSFAQAYDYGRLGLKVPMGLGSDLNGFIQQTRPRFGPDACSASFSVEGLCQARDERESGPAALGRGFDEMGLGHIGLLPDLLDDLDGLGTDTAPLRSSADDFVRMWERASGPRSGPVEGLEDIVTDGIVPGPTHNERLAEYPTMCDAAYCPGALAAGERCRFAAECESESCMGAGECGNPLGTCL
jgi:microsomal dipeptidase-like Zn-dependent dipeptidase